jgi:hypothetical protein
MQLTKLFEVVRKIRVDAKFDSFISELRRLIETSENIDIQPVRNVFHALVLETREALVLLKQDSDNRAVIAETKIEMVFNAGIVAKLMHGFQAVGNYDQFRGRTSDFAQLAHIYNTIKAFVVWSEALKNLIEIPRVKTVGADEGLLQFEVLEVDARGFSLDRIAEIIPEINGFYVQVARLYQSDESRVRIAFADSGSPLIIAIKGDSKVIDAMRKCFESVWDRIRFIGAAGVERKIDALEKSVDLLAKVHSREADGSLTPEESLRIRTLLIGNVTGLIAKGTATRETYEKSVIDNRRLMLEKVETKYLESGTAPNTSVGPS